MNASTNASGTTTIDIPGVGKMEMSQDGQTVKINGNVDGQDFQANVRTEQ